MLRWPPRTPAPCCTRRPCRLACRPSSAPVPLLSSANSLTSASSGVVRLIGGPLGGVLLAACGIRWLIGADALSYLLAAAAMFVTSRSCRGHRERNALVKAVARDLIEGTRVLRAQPAARSLLPVTTVFLTANAALGAVLIPFAIQRLGGSEHTGLLLACLGAGYLVGAPVIRAFLDRAEPRNLLTASLAATAGAYLPLFTSSSLATAAPAAATAGHRSQPRHPQRSRTGVPHRAADARSAIQVSPARFP
jgi:predicted MFS family arabinose efflux permease